MIRVLTLALLLATAARADWEATYRLPRFERDDIFVPFSKQWPHLEESGLSKEEWKGLREAYLKTFGISTIRRDGEDALITFRSGLGERASDGIVRALYAHWRNGRVADLRARAFELRAEIRELAERRDAQRKTLREFAARGAVWSRADGVRAVEERMRELRYRLVDARIEAAVLEARAKALRQQVAVHRERREDALDDRIDELEEELVEERKRFPAQETIRVQLLETRLMELRAERAFPDPRLLDVLAELEIDLVAQEELVKQYEARIEEESRRRVEIATRPDLASVQDRIFDLEREIRELEETEQELEHRANELRKLRPERVDG